MKLYDVKLWDYNGLQWHQLSFGSLVKQLHFSNTLLSKDLMPSTNWQPCMWKTSQVLSRGEDHDNPTWHQKPYSMISRRPFLLKDGTLFISRGRNYITSTSRNFSNMNVTWHTWSNHWHHHNVRSFVPYCTTSHRLVTEIGQWSTIIRIDTLCHFCSYNVLVEDEAHFVLGFPLYNSIRDNFNHYSRL
jgi:hypothetical protein